MKLLVTKVTVMGRRVECTSDILIPWGNAKKINIYMCGLHYIALLSVFLLSSSIKQGNNDGPDGFP